jgi:hypothetical protein
MTRRFQFSLRAVLVLMFGAACFFAGIRLERERQREKLEFMEAKFKLLQEIAEDLQLDWPNAKEKPEQQGQKKVSGTE